MRQVFATITVTTTATNNRFTVCAPITLAQPRPATASATATAIASMCNTVWREDATTSTAIASKPQCLLQV